MEQSNNKKVREFKLTTLALKNKNTIFFLIAVLFLFGAISYNNLPKELFPDVNYPTIIIQTVYPGNPPEDIENLITRPIEKELKSLDKLDRLRSLSPADASIIFVEFTADTQTDDVLQDVKDAVDKAKPELPEDLPSDPEVMDFDFSEFPIININLSGNYSINELEDYAEILQDRLETISEISKAEIKGLSDREIQVNIDKQKMDALNISFTSIENAIKFENVSMSAGEIKANGTTQSLRIIGEFENTEDIENIIVKQEGDKVVYLKDIGEVKDTYADATSIARLNKQTVVSVQVIKKSGENLLAAADQVFAILDQAKESGEIPADLTVTITNDQSDHIRKQLSNLENSMIMGILFVIGVLFFFLGLRNALFVGLAIPLSMFLSFTILGIMGATINMIVLFSLILALGMLVDNAIVTVENIYRFVDQGATIKQAAKQAVGEIAMPIISSTATTLAAFFPLIFWQSLMGEFMKFLPVTLIIVLTSSLFVALVILPVLSSVFVKPTSEQKAPNKKKVLLASAILLIVAGIFYLLRIFGIANFISLGVLFMLLNVYLLYGLARWFRVVFLRKLENFYDRFIRFSLRGKNPYWFLVGTVLMLFATIAFLGARSPKVEFFPDNEPQYINIIAELPIGTSIHATDSTMKVIENDLDKVLAPYQKVIESVLTTVGEGVSKENEFATGNTPNKGQITVKFVDYKERRGISTFDIMKKVSGRLINQYPGIKFFVEKNSSGPPTGAPINIEVSGKDLNKLIEVSDTILSRIDQAKIRGIEGLEMDIETGNPEIIVSIDRDKAQRMGLSTMQIAGAIRTALFGSEVSDFKEDEDEYPIQVRLKEKYRNSLAALMNMRISFRNNKGRVISVPISAVAKIKHSNSVSSVRRIDQERTITLSSNVLTGYNANEVNALIRAELATIDIPHGYTYSFTGEQQEQQESMEFLFRAMLIAISIILIILVSQFNSFVKPFIIIASVFFSTIGVLGGIATFNMNIVVVMTGVGIISLAGVVVNNAIVLIDYIDYLKNQRKQELGIDVEDGNLPIQEIYPLVVQAGKTRLRPVLLTAITTILGLIPLAVGFNIDFNSMLTEFNPDIYFGGENALFWGPMSWTVIFGLSFATFLTLVIVPAMYLITNKIKLYFVNRKAE